MIRIERLNLRLPPGFEHRTASIAQLVGESLASSQLTESHTLDSLSVGPLVLPANATDRDVAEQVRRWRGAAF